MNTWFLKFLFAAYLVAVFISPKADGKTVKQPNIILIMADDWGWGDFGFQFQNQRANKNNRSEPWAKTPNLDRIAEMGVQLPNQYSPAPVCAPSRASLMLGQHQGHANVRDNQFDKAIEDNHTIATILKAAGYSTAAFGKWGLQGKGNSVSNWIAHPLNRGFDYYLGYMRHGDGHEHYPKEGVYRGKKEVYENYKNIADGLDKCYTADLWTAATKKWIVEQKQSGNPQKPFFIFLGFDTPHAVCELPTQAYPEGGGLKGGLQWLGKEGHMINTASGEVDSWIHPDYAIETWDNDKNPSTPEVEWPNVYKRYATSTRRIDDAIGDLIQLLKDLSISDNTLIVFTSDNGPSKESYLPEDYEPDFFNGFGPFDGIKRDVMEGGVRVSALAYWPGKIPAGRVVNNPSSSYDWLPTFAEFAGVAAPAVSDGVSLLPSLTGRGKQKESFVYVEYFEGGKTPDYEEFIPGHRGKKRNQMQMIRQKNFVGIRYNIQSHNDNFEIFDISKDLQQASNLATKPGMESIQQQMKDKVLQSRRPDDEAKRPYDNEFVPPIPDEKIINGVNWNLYSGKFLWVSEVSALTPYKTGICSQPNANVSKPEVSQMVLFSGYIKVPADGEYTFFLNTNRGAFLRIHNASVIDADFGYTPKTERKGSVKLKAGLHPYRLYYSKNSTDQPFIDFQWSSSSIAKQIIPATVFFRNKTNKNELITF